MNLTPTLDAPARPAAAGSLLDFTGSPFDADFNRRPFLIRHHLCGHSLFQLPRLLELARQLPEASVEYNAGNADLSQDPTRTPRNGLSIEETVRRIAECKSWMVLKNVEQAPEYRDLLNACLAEVERRGHPDGQGVCRREGFVFLSSPGSVTPYHMDPELNFLLQIQGKKTMSVFPSHDRSVLSDEELERFHAGAAHRNLSFKDEYQAKAQTFELTPGVGLHVPQTDPHWVKNGDEVSVSFSITFQSRRSERSRDLYTWNHLLRQRGWKPTPVGRSPLRDAVQLTTYRVLRRLGFAKGEAATKGY